MKREISKAVKYMKRCSVSLLRDVVSHLLDLQTSESCITQYAYRDVQEPSSTWRGQPWGKSIRLRITKLHNNVSSDPATPPVGIFFWRYTSSKIKPHIHKFAHSSTVYKSERLETISGFISRTQVREPGYIHAMKYYTTVKTMRKLVKS